MFTFENYTFKCNQKKEGILLKKGLSPIFLAVVMVFAMVGSMFSGISNVFAAESTEQNLKVMTFNLRYENNNDPSPHTWAERVPTIKKLIRMENPDIFGTQEVLYGQLQDLEEVLPGYAWIGLGREGGNRGEYTAIFYDEKRFTPVEYDHFWLSDTPDVIGSKTWGNNIPRMVTWAKFVDNQTDKQFYFVNTHFDHQSAEAREKSAELILDRIKEFNPELPIVLTGDFNTRPGTLPHQTLTSDEAFDDLWETAESRINEGIGTFNGFRDPTGGGADNRIDWILTKGNVTANTIEINNYQKNGQFPSDHYPVIAEITIK